jgi:hypothetical protein
MQSLYINFSFLSYVFLFRFVIKMPTKLVTKQNGKSKMRRNYHWEQNIQSMYFTGIVDVVM